MKMLLLTNRKGKLMPGSTGTAVMRRPLSFWHYRGRGGKIKRSIFINIRFDTKKKERFVRHSCRDVQTGAENGI